MLIIFFLFFLFFENLFLPAIIGPKPFFIIPLFILSVVFYDHNLKHGFAKAITFLLLMGLFASVNVFAFFSSFFITVAVYLAITHFLNIELMSNKIFSISVIMRDGAILLFLGLVYSLFFIWPESSYNFHETFNKWIILAKTAGLSMFLLSAAISSLFGHVSKKK